MLALAESAQKAADNLKSTGLGMQATGTNTLHLLESGSISKAMRIVVTFSMQSFLALQDIRTGSVQATQDTADTNRPKSNKDGQKSGANRTRKESNKMP